MPKGTKPTDAPGQITFKYVEFSVSGADPTLQDAMKTLAATIMRGNGALPTRQVKGAGTKQIESASNGADHEVADEVVDSDETVEDAEAAPAPAARAPRAKPKVKAYSVRADLVFDDVSPTPREFAAEKVPTSDLKKYLTIAYWFKNYKKQPNMTAEIFYTAYRELKWTVPNDPFIPMRDLRSKRDGRMSKGSEAGTAQINQIGENDVDALGKTT